MDGTDPLTRVCELFGLAADSPRLAEALTHPSYAHEVKGATDNQRLEFLGDAVLDFAASELLFARFPRADEGELTRRRAQVVSTQALAEFARRHDLAEAVRFGRGAQQGNLKESENVLADAVEALLSAVYLDHGLEAARQACLKVIEFGLERGPTKSSLDAKSELQERAQAVGLRAPIYEVVLREGPAHDTTFEVVVRIGEVTVGRGKGRSKRTAEQEAARDGLERQAEWTPAPPSSEEGR